MLGISYKYNYKLFLIITIIVIGISSCGGGGGGGSTPSTPQTGNIEGNVYVPVGSEAVARMVLDAQPGYKPLADANISASCGTTTKTAKTNSSGYFKLSSLPVVSCNVTISKTGFTNIPITVKVKAGTTVKVDGGTGNVNMNPSTFGSIRVRANVSGGNVIIDNVDTKITIPVSMSYTFNSIAPGQHTVNVTQSGYDSLTAQTVNITAGSTSEVAFSLNPTGNHAPVANAGADGKTFVATCYKYVGPGSNLSDYTPHANYYTLDGSGSSDADSNPLTYRWEQTSGTSVSISNSTASKTTFIPTQAGTYMFKLTVNDGYLDSTPDYVSVIANKVSGKIVYTTPGSRDIFSINADGTNFKRLTNNRYYDGLPRWSPDGNKILFITNPSGDETTKYPAIINSDGTGIYVLSTDFGGLDWSPDGQYILILKKYNGHYELYRSLPDGSSLTRLTTTGRDVGFAYYSPDGTHIAFEQNVGGDVYQIFIMDADGGNLTRLTNDSLLHGYVNWTPDGRILYTTASTITSNHVLYVMNADGTGKQIWTVPSGVNDVEHMTMTNDGNYIFYKDNNFILHVMYSDGSADLNLGLCGMQADYNPNP